MGGKYKYKRQSYKKLFEILYRLPYKNKLVIHKLEIPRNVVFLSEKVVKEDSD